MQVKELERRMDPSCLTSVTVISLSDWSGKSVFTLVSALWSPTQLSVTQTLHSQKL